MTRGAGRSRGYRAQDSALRPGKVVVPFGESSSICVACRQHKHHACWAHTAALGLGGEPGCPCGCHVPLDEPVMTPEAIDDMAAHGTLAAHVKAQAAWALGSGPGHFGETCRRCDTVQRTLHGEEAGRDSAPGTATDGDMPVTSDELRARITQLEAQLAQRTPPPIGGQASIPLEPIRHHLYSGDGGPCTTELFGEVCAEPADHHERSNGRPCPLN